MIIILGAVILGLSLLMWVVGGAIIGSPGYYFKARPSAFLDSVLPHHLRGAPLWVKVTSPIAVVGSVAGAVLLVVGLFA